MHDKGSGGQLRHKRAIRVEGGGEETGEKEGRKAEGGNKGQRQTEWKLK